MSAIERDDMLALLLTPGIGHALARRCVETFGSASAALEASVSQWADIRGIGRNRAGDIRRALQQVIDEDQVSREKQLLERHAVRMISIDDPEYPKLLRYIPDSPCLLWVRGELREQDALALAMVGSRRASHYGREQAERLAALAADSGLTIVSGGAYGIDAAAHRGALKVGGRTLAVIGSGLCDPYPLEHHNLFDQVAAGHGAVISEVPMRTSPRAELFPARNRIISGLSLGVLVIEAAKRSGALITARLCVEEHGRECMAMPGRVDSRTSEGCHKLIRDGTATLVTNLADVLDCLGETGQLLKTSPTASEPQSLLFTDQATTPQRSILDAIEQPLTLDQIIAVTGLSVSQVQSELTMLEIRGAVKRSGGLFVRKS
ncbi:MAG: DNA-protecting protein DprA [Phycisphaeraceae bacterium]|nr:DNA-protecting protein DprA [Phycisphaeraceae bacterium]